MFSGVHYCLIGDKVAPIIGDTLQLSLLDRDCLYLLVLVLGKLTCLFCLGGMLGCLLMGTHLQMLAPFLGSLEVKSLSGEGCMHFNSNGHVYTLLCMHKKFQSPVSLPSLRLTTVYLDGNILFFKKQKK